MFDDRPPGWSVPVPQCFFAPPLSKGIPSTWAILIVMVTANLAFMVTFWVVPVAGAVWALLAVLLHYDPDILTILRRYLKQQRYYYG